MQQPSLMVSLAALRADKAGGDVAGWLLTGDTQAVLNVYVTGDVGKGGKVTVTEQQCRDDLHPKGANLPVVPVG